MAETTFLYMLRLIRPGVVDAGPTPEEMATLGRHFTYLTRLYDQGVVQMAGRSDSTGDTTRGFCLLKADSLEAAEAIAAADPAVVEGLMTVETFPFRVAIGGFLPP